MSIDIVCLSLLRWDSIFQRPQHLLSRCARERRVFFIEEPVYAGEVPHLSLDVTPEGVQVVTPVLPEGTPADGAERLQRELIDLLIAGEEIERPVLWYYSPMALVYTHHLNAGAVVYDCMDDLSATQGVPETLHDREELLLSHADVVFTARPGLYQARSSHHGNAHLVVNPDDELGWDHVWAEMWELVEDSLLAQELPRHAQAASEARGAGGTR